MKTHTKNIAFIALLAVMIPLSSMAQPGPRFQGKDNRGPGYNECRLEQIIPDLTPEQSEQLKTLRLEQLASSQDFRNQMGEIRAKQRTLMSENPMDQKALENLIEKKSDLMKIHQKEVLAHQVAVRDVLTDDQLLVMNQFKQRQCISGQRMGRYQQAGFGRKGFGPGRNQGYRNKGRW